MQRYKVTVVNYLNSKPFMYGIQKTDLKDKIDFLDEFPALCAESLIQGKTDLALIPAAMILHLKSPHITSSYCIGSDGKVQTVCLFSNVPIEEVTDVILDYQSRTSVRLFQILAKEYWKIQPTYHASEPGFSQHIQGTTAAVLIGDRTIKFFDKYPYVYDLGEIWKLYTGLPFVFAAWVADKALEPDFVKEFHHACEIGMQSIDEIVKDYKVVNNEYFDLERYYKEYMSYNLDEQKLAGLDLFLTKVAELENWPKPELIYKNVK